MLRVLIILFTLSIFSGCTSSEVETRDLYYIEKIQSDYFSDYHYITATKNSKVYYIVSEKKLLDVMCNNKLKEHTFYKIQLDSIKKPIETSIERNQGAIIYNGDVLYYANGRVYGEFYSCPNLIGLCLNKYHHIFHYP
jgi:hypothetical protein